MTSYNIILSEEGEQNSGFRTKNVPGDKARAVLIDQGNALIAKAVLVNATHGDFTEGGDAATLLIFEFTFISMKPSSHRFTSGKIILTLDDDSGNTRNRPEVVKISPTGTFAINKTTSIRDVKHTVTTSIKPEAMTAAAGELGYAWEATEVKETKHATALIGIKRLLGDYGKDNCVIWSLEEDSFEKQGIPSFLRTAVIVRRRDDVPFRFSIRVETGVDSGGKLRRFLGMEKADPVDPVELDDETDLDELGITSLESTTFDSKNMQQMDIGKYADVMIASLLSIPA